MSTTAEKSKRWRVVCEETGFKSHAMTRSAAEHRIATIADAGTCAHTHTLEEIR